jgi:hypothetical protein
MKSRITSSDIFDINKKSGALILGSNRLDDYATKYLTKYCKEALAEPMPLPVEKILQDMGLDVKVVSLSSNLDVFGCCLLLDGCVEIYDQETKEYISTAFNAGTVLIDPSSISAYGEGSKRNTLIHEALHWEKDKTYFEILEVKNKNAAEKLSPMSHDRLNNHHRRNCRSPQIPNPNQKPTSNIPATKVARCSSLRKFSAAYLVLRVWNNCHCGHRLPDSGADFYPSLQFLR